MIERSDRGRRTPFERGCARPGAAALLAGPLLAGCLATAAAQHPPTSLVTDRLSPAEWILDAEQTRLPAAALQAAAHFQLFSDCRPMRLLIGRLTADGRALGLTRSAVREAAVLRLTAGGVRLDEGAKSALLTLAVLVQGPAFDVSLRHSKPVLDGASGQMALAVTWQRGAQGLHGGRADYVQSAARRLVEHFGEAYGKVHAAGCATVPAMVPGVP